MSTLSSQLIVCSSALVEDLYGIFSSKKLSAAKSLWLGRAGVAIVALVAGALAWNPNSSFCSWSHSLGLASVRHSARPFCFPSTGVS